MIATAIIIILILIIPLLCEHYYYKGKKAGEDDVTIWLDLLFMDYNQKRAQLGLEKIHYITWIAKESQHIKRRSTTEEICDNEGPTP